ncbi:M56 family metallopeptidase [Parabacteroides sp. OttesenSCG-928-G07]|nr:M56 family metallopeptidase [Parabacteroides sp. OttesenSCG-928-G07]
MGTFLVYIIKSSCCLALFYLGYKAMLSNETFFRFNRKVLIGGMIICLLLPFVKIPVDSPQLIQQPFLELERIMTVEESLFLSDETMQIEENTLFTEAISTRYQAYVLMGVYTIGWAITFTLLFISFISLCLLIMNGRSLKVNDYILILLKEPISPFNWWKYIVISDSDYRQYPDEIITHELAHYYKRHSWDLLFAESVILLHWFNPAAWLLKRELQEVHEFQADREVLNMGVDATKYQLLLVKKAVSSSSYTFANSFNQSKLKKRITMMFKNQSKPWARLKLIWLLPVAICALYAFANPDVNRQLEQLLPNEGTINLQDKKYTKAYFEKEFAANFKNLPADPRERQDYLEKNANTVTLLVNSISLMLFEGDFITPEVLATELQNKYAAFKDDKPFVINLQHDSGTPPETVEQVLSICGQFIDEKGQKSKHPLLLNNIIPKSYIYTEFNISTTPAADEQGIYLTFHHNDRESKTIKIDLNMSMAELKELMMQEKRTTNFSLISLKAPQNTPMGFITDLKQTLREVYNLFLKMDYSGS